jgi:hypothetical protein
MILDVESDIQAEESGRYRTKRTKEQPSIAGMAREVYHWHKQHFAAWTRTAFALKCCIASSHDQPRDWASTAAC